MDAEARDLLERIVADLEANSRQQHELARWTTELQRAATRLRTGMKAQTVYAMLLDRGVIVVADRLVAR